MKHKNVDHGKIGEWPAGQVATYVSIWAIESKKSPGWVGWWVVAEHWQETASLMAVGKSPPDFRVGNEKNWIELAPLLKSRASILINWLNKESNWEDLDEYEGIY